jgi:hypothetical protein
MRFRIKFLGFILLVLSLVVITSCVKSKVDEPSPLGPVGYAISLKVSAGSNVIFAGSAARDSTTVTAVLTRFDGTPLSGRTIYFEVNDAFGLRTPDSYGYFEGHQAVASRVTDGSGTATVTYHGPKAAEIDSNQYLYITANIVWEGAENITEWAPVYIVRDFTDLIFNVKVDPNVLWCSNQRPESAITVFYAIPDGTPIVGRKIFFEITSGLGNFGDGKTKTFKKTNANGYAVITYRGPTAGQMGKPEDWVDISVQPETWWEEFGDYYQGIDTDDYYLHVEFRIRLKKGN